MGGRAWSQEELIRLEELTETYPLATVARKLNRSENAVFLKRQRTGIGGFMANTDMLTRNTISRILGVENRTLQYWERKGLKSVRKNPYVMYRQQDIIRYMEEHPEGRKAMAEVKIWPRGQNETGGILLMPMKKNIPKGHPEWSLVKCPICGQECWRPISRQELRQKKMQAACTECGLKIESRRTNP